MTGPANPLQDQSPEQGLGGAAIVVPLVSTLCSSWTRGSSWRFLAPANRLLAALLPAPGAGLFAYLVP